MNYEEWVKSVPVEITGDPLWTVQACRLALFAADLGWYDVTKFMKDKRTMEIADQLYRAPDSIGANISEGYSRGGGRDRVRFYEYALGSTRESRDWCYGGRHVLGEVVIEYRIHLLTQTVRLLLRMIPDQRNATFQEEAPAYGANCETVDQEPLNRANLDAFVQSDAPLP